MEMHQIRYFLAVCETLNFTRAAEACNVSQPSLTRAIKGLEDELGGPLFRRERNNTHLTGLGEMMRPHLTQVLIETDAAKERAKSFAKLDDVELKLGMMCTIGPRRFVPFLQAFRDRHPKVKLVVQDGSNVTLQERLAQGELDVAVYGQPEEIDERFHARRLYDERFVIGVGPGHVFEKQNAVRCADLHEQAYVNRVQCEFFGAAGKIFREQNGRPRIVFRSDRDDWVQSMAMAGRCGRPRTVTTWMARVISGSISGRTRRPGMVTAYSGMKVKPRPAIAMLCTQSSRSLRKTMRVLAPFARKTFPAWPKYSH